MIPRGLVRTLFAMGGLIFVGSLLATSCLTPDFNFGDAGNLAGASGLESCDNGRRDGSETDVDCGGSCPPCSIGDGCSRARDCESPPDDDLAITQCVSGSCALLCPASRADCNLMASDGCEINLLSSVDHCGECRQPCNPPSATGQCQMGSCAILRCDDGFADVNGAVEDGCEIDTNTDPKSCGPSRVECSSAGGTPRCEDGLCIMTCHSGFADCNENATDGCEVNLSSNAQSCGECGNVCPAGAGEAAYCVDGTCGVTLCNPGLGDCDGDGQCEEELTTTNNCGSCGNICSAPNGAPTCTDEACTVASCNPGFADCTDDPGCETPTQSDPNHCGGCGQACSTNNVANVSCTGGNCTPGCSDGWCPGTNPRTQGCTVRRGTPQACASCSDVCGSSAPFCVAEGDGTHGCRSYIPVSVRNTDTTEAWQLPATPALTHQLSRGSGNRRVVIVGLTAVWNGAPSVNVLYDGQPMTPAARQTRSDSEAIIFYILDEHLPSTEGTYSVAITDASDWGSLIIHVVELANARQGPPTHVTFQEQPHSCHNISTVANVANPRSFIYAAAMTRIDDSEVASVPSGFTETRAVFQEPYNYGMFGYRGPEDFSQTLSWTNIHPCWSTLLVTATFSSVTP